MYVEFQLLFLISGLVWLLTLIGIVTVGFWVFEVLLLRTSPVKDSDYGAEDVQIRIMTIDSEKIVQESVNALPEKFSDINIVAETDIEVNGAEVHVVPENFSCDAVRKSRAMEWASRNLDAEKEFILYLDEDSHLKNFSGLPDADVVQLRERPQRTGSLLAYLADVFRMGFRMEQLAFPSLKIPLFAWGGGLAVRKEMEEKITWERESIVEDTVFLWYAAMKEKCSFAVTDTYIENQSPSTVKDLLNQRRRWAGGNHSESKNLPRDYRVLSRLRNYAWALTPVTAFLLPVILLFNPVNLYGENMLNVLGISLAMVIPTWYLLGVFYYPENRIRNFLYLPLSPVAAILHGIGGLWGVINPPEKFLVTPKTPTAQINRYYGYEMPWPFRMFSGAGPEK